MNRAEFLSILRESLEGNMPKEDVEANLRYYRDYFAQSEHSDKEVCEELGDPRLIAKSLIDAYMASKDLMQINVWIRRAVNIARLMEKLMGMRRRMVFRNYFVILS